MGYRGFTVYIFTQRMLSTVAKFLVPDWGYKVDAGIDLLYRVPFRKVT
jgi:hypothetical protein